MSSISEIAACLKNRKDMAFQPVAEGKQIAEFEAKQGLCLPEEYRQWLCISDGGDLYLPAGVQFYGVAHKPLIDVDYDDRPSDTYVVIGELASGDPVLFQKGSEQIAIYNHEAGRIEDDEIYPDFAAFLLDLEEILGIGD